MGHPTNVAQTTIGGDASYTQPGMRPLVLLDFKHDGDTRLGSAADFPTSRAGDGRIDWKAKSHFHWTNGWCHGKA